ncbi:TRAP transporter large permease subunit [Photobacterium sp. GJ3]|uniref:TRAP transporter large permease n=1 Tax=Photobacterium sp. GJ3 TaxID=2829502 RepID=UPI001B8C1CAD|nr:TRAP transporter large permease subunit [Photobacterium sp. GJ3]QUJ68536.1 TRAP transporter large permease subunit [Photobacterium sp. GJ3]
MDFMTAGLICIGSLLFFMALGVQIGLSFLLSGFISSFFMLGFDSSISLMGQAAYFSIASPTWTAIPLFILMGAFASNGGLARLAYQGVHGLSRGIPGSLMVATCLSCGIFGAVSGSSIATTAIFGKMALPEMNRLRYDKALSIGCIASAGTFASMIPPSMMMIIYALFTQQSIGKLFAAGILPGLMTIVAYAALIIFMVKRNPALAPNDCDLPSSHPQSVGAAGVHPRRRDEVMQMWPVIVIAVVVLGGLYSGIFTPTESAAAGALVTLGLAFFIKNFKGLNQVNFSMQEAASVTAMLFLINIGALFYSRVLAVTRLPTEMTMLLQHADVPPFAILLGILAIMFVLGMVMVPIGIYALTLPIVLPIIMELGYDPIWFGVIALKLTEIGAITPPVGLNVFAMKGAIPKGMNISLEQVYKGCMPFLLVDIAILILLILFPQIALWLPEVIA